MFQKISLQIVLFISVVGFAQEPVTRIPIELKREQSVFQIVDTTKQNVLLFLTDKERVKSMRLDKNMQIIDSLSTARPEKEYTSIIGYNDNGKSYRLYWASSDNESVISQVYDFENKKIQSQQYNLPLKNEEVLQQFTHDNSFYILTALKNSNTIKFYIFDKEGILQEKTVSLNVPRFYNSQAQRIDFYNLVKESLSPSERSYSLKMISTDSPTSLTDAAHKRKCYLRGKFLVITLDMSFACTQMIYIDLQKFVATEALVAKPFISYIKPEDLNSNSFLLGNRLYQVKISYKKIAVSIKDFDKSTVKDYIVENDLPINFKNGDIIQENGDTESLRVLESTSQFMRKINSSNLAISGYNLDNNDLITLGSVSEEQADLRPAMYGAPFGALGVILAYAVINPTVANFNSYSNRKVVYINSLFDGNGNHVKGPVKKLAFDKIRKFADELNDDSMHTLYKYESTYYLGYYAKKEKEYVLTKFNE